MKICIVNTFYYPDMIGGAEVCVVKIAEQLSKYGHEVHVICTDKKNSCEIINGITVHSNLQVQERLAGVQAVYDRILPELNSIFGE